MPITHTARRARSVDEGSGEVFVMASAEITPRTESDDPGGNVRVPMVPTRPVVGAPQRVWSRRSLVALAMTVALIATVTAACGGGSSNAKPSRPNIVFLLTDDQRWDSMSQLPIMSSQPEWAKFENAFIEDPQCCPSRAAILTGRHTEHTRVHTLLDGGKLDPSTTIATLLHGAGYRTGFYGKYLNGFPFKNRTLVPPGWDTFQANTGLIVYDDYTLIQNGNTKHYGPSYYPTELLTQRAVHFINKTKKSEPLFLDVAYNAPHATDKGPPVPEQRDVGSCSSEKFDTPPNFNSVDKIRDPKWIKGTLPLGKNDMAYWRTKTCETLRSVDRSVKTIIDTLRKQGRLSNTYIVFLSDNGYAFGEHRLTGKGDLYEASIRVPLWVRGPGVKPGTYPRLTSNIDITPTFLDWAGVDAPKGFLDGHSFAADLRGDDTHDPQAVLLRGCRTVRTDSSVNTSGESGACGSYASGMGLNWGVRTQQYKLIVNPGNDLQLFDLQKDPFELSNVAYEPAYKSVVAQLETTLTRLRGAS
jgi:arylsulfatase A-like enzyme